MQPPGQLEILEHTADKAIIARAGSLADLFATAAWGMFGLMVEMDGAPGDDKREIADQLVDFQHRFTGSIVSSLHVHLDAHNCLEVLIIRDTGANIKKIADNLVGTKGVKHGKLTMATVGKDIV